MPRLLLALLGAGLLGAALICFLSSEPEVVRRARLPAVAPITARERPAVCEPADTAPRPASERIAAPVATRSNPSDPEPEAIAKLEALSEARDASGLLDLVRSERSLIRHEALRRALELSGPRALVELRGLFADPDPALHEVLGTAFGAGGSSEDADALAGLLPSLSPTARLAAAGAILEIAQRFPAPWAERSALEWLETLARDPDLRLAEDACTELPRGADRAGPVLTRLASDRGLDSGIRLTAAEALTDLDPAAAEAQLEALAAEAPDTPAGAYARDLLGRD